ncbi:MAG: ATP-binding cassette domain-containing protein [Candidatus Nanopelagicales bacterium]|jgi:ABC-2 type transport system ATP-binding protein|nr:ATP-binding cassette domain-containing protein [Actinomycetes bacterium]MCU0301194.1 ATP-binding cassette domain-containing protein [Candidatus Nanopelagicales bacterium]
MGVVETSELTRRFGSITAVDGLTLDLPAGGVIGLVGPNGSGKSTLIRMLLGLIRPGAGSAHVLGASIAQPARYAARVGALVERPAFVPGLSARTNLRALARLRGLPDDRVDEVLGIVGLTGREREPVKRFSLGMQQRLAIAAALLPDPELLVLDEPTNGLDPAGIVEIRALLMALGRSGRTVVVSSHLLAEIEAACDWIVVLRFGELVFSGPTEALLARTRAHIDLRPEHATDLPALLAALQAAGWAAAREADLIRVVATADRAAALNRAASDSGVTLAHLVVVQDSLEDVFLAMTGRSDGELAVARAGAVA